MIEYNKEEEITFRTDLFRRMDKQDGVLEEIKTQTTKTNGRVTVLEITTKDYEKYKNIVSSLKGWKMWITGAVGVIIFVGGFVWNLILTNILNTAKENTQAMIDKSLQNTQILIDRSAEGTAQKVISRLEEKYKLEIK